jgi:hypothetical protein
MSLANMRENMPPHSKFKSIDTDEEDQNKPAVGRRQRVAAIRAKANLSPDKVKKQSTANRTVVKDLNQHFAHHKNTEEGNGEPVKKRQKQTESQQNSDGAALLPTVVRKGKEQLFQTTGNNEEEEEEQTTHEKDQTNLSTSPTTAATEVETEPFQATQASHDDPFEDIGEEDIENNGTITLLSQQELKTMTKGMYLKYGVQFKK